MPIKTGYMWYILLLLAGFIPLIYGANLLVDNASSLAKRLNIPNIVIGLTIVAFGTSAPELIVNLFASVAGNSDMVMGNVIGSNLFNILAILGISTFIYPLTVKRNTTWIEIPLTLLSAIVVLVLANDVLIDKSAQSFVSRIDGIILLSFFSIFLVYNILMALKDSFSEEIAVKNKAVLPATVLVIAGVLLLVIGGRAIVVSAVEVAKFIGISNRVIALTIVSVGTSLPELATSIVAARKKNTDIAIGNIVGSNLFNVFFILGTSAVVHPIVLQAQSNFDLVFNVFVSLLLFVFLFTGKGRRIDRWEGLIFMVLYVAYVVFLILN